jgi:D-alanine-D-alanine ligase
MKVLVLFDMPRPVAPDESFTLRELRQEENGPTEADVISCLRKLGHEVETLGVYDDVVAIVDKVRAFSPAVVFNLCESFFNERSNEANIPALLELLRVPYTGATPEALLLCKDKAVAKTILMYHKIRVPRFVVSRKRRPLQKLRRFHFPAFVKPLGEESSDGIAKASFAKTEPDAIDRARFVHDKLGCDAMIEEFIEGRELYAAVLGGRKLTVFPPRELFFGDMPDGEPKFATRKAKWDDSYRIRWGIHNGPAAPLPPGIDKKLTELARRTHSYLKIHGALRIDLRLTPGGDIVFIEANPNPSLARIDDYAAAARDAGMDYETLIQRILESARAH